MCQDVLDDGSCSKLSKSQRELPCISPYCRPFKYMPSTENWAEQYRFFYQSSTTRDLLAVAGLGAANCLQVLQSHDAPTVDNSPTDEALPPWRRGLPDIVNFHPSRWDSCGGRACKAW